MKRLVLLAVAAFAALWVSAEGTDYQNFYFANGVWNGGVQGVCDMSFGDDRYIFSITNEGKMDESFVEFKRKYGSDPTMKIALESLQRAMEAQAQIDNMANNLSRLLTVTGLRFTDTAKKTYHITLDNTTLRDALVAKAMGKETLPAKADFEVGGGSVLVDNLSISTNYSRGGALQMNGYLASLTYQVPFHGYNGLEWNELADMPLYFETEEMFEMYDWRVWCNNGLYFARAYMPRIMVEEGEDGEKVLKQRDVSTGTYEEVARFRDSASGSGYTNKTEIVSLDIGSDFSAESNLVLDFINKDGEETTVECGIAESYADISDFALTADPAGNRLHYALIGIRRDGTSAVFSGDVGVGAIHVDAVAFDNESISSNSVGTVGIKGWSSQNACTESIASMLLGNVTRHDFVARVGGNLHYSKVRDGAFLDGKSVEKVPTADQVQLKGWAAGTTSGQSLATALQASEADTRHVLVRDGQNLSYVAIGNGLGSKMSASAIDPISGQEGAHVVGTNMVFCSASDSAVKVTTSQNPAGQIRVEIGVYYK